MRWRVHALACARVLNPTGVNGSSAEVVLEEVLRPVDARGLELRPLLPSGDQTVDVAVEFLVGRVGQQGARPRDVGFRRAGRWRSSRYMARRPLLCALLRCLLARLAREVPVAIVSELGADAEQLGDLAPWDEVKS